MRKYYTAAVLCIAVMAAAGCSGSSAPESAPVSSQQESAAPISSSEEITIGHIDDATAAGADGDPVIADDNSTFYEYGGRRYRHDRSEPSGAYIESGGSYTGIPDNAPGAAEAQKFTIDTIMESFSGSEWKYIGSLEQNGRSMSYYLDSTGDIMLEFVDISEEADSYDLTLSDGERMVGVSLLKALVS